MSDDLTKQKFHFWIQIFTGNWSTPPYSKPEDVLWSSLSASIVFTINILSLGLIGLAVTRLNTLRRIHIMKLKDVYTIRDAAIKSSVRKLLSESKEFSVDQLKSINGIINSAFERGDQYWSDRLLARIAELEGMGSPKQLKEHIENGELTGSAAPFNGPS